MQVSQLKITAFRNISSLNLEVPESTGDSGQLIAIIGKNGAGKTSVLEALSLLSPGRGLHKAKPEDMVQHKQKQWGVFALCEGQRKEQYRVGQSYLRSKTRKLKINEDNSAKQGQLAEVGNVLWLTPRQDRLFLDGAAVRRDFLDRFVYGLKPDHAEVMSRYKHHIGARLRLLKQGAAADWLGLEEQQAAEFGVQVLQNRLLYVEKLAEHLEEVSLKLTGATLGIFEEEDTVAALKGKFERSRERDAEVGATHTGAQKVDLSGVLHIDEQEVDLAAASSGQHKRGLIQIVLAHVRLMKEKQGQAPLVLIDEVAAHLDAEKRTHLLGSLTELGAQVWITETELERLGNIEPDIVFTLDNGQLTLEGVS
ncbi:MAG: DNA replication and repair protein RecF [Alphaproteobacteria bacterium]|nr:DNA replication and repair protein RecF [Alphaproteobacteria bacterium]MDD9920621.1 DNA replication and repair protein RecF [Alphaproteobacteria bacterium]